VDGAGIDLAVDEHDTKPTITATMAVKRLIFPRLRRGTPGTIQS
jgi:hypothetical protein